MNNYITISKDGEYRETPISPTLDQRVNFLQLSQDGITYFRSRDNPNNYYPMPVNCMSSTISNTSRPLITPDEVMRLPEIEQIVFIKGISPILCYRHSYRDIAWMYQYSEIEPPDKINFA